MTTPPGPKRGYLTEEQRIAAMVRRDQYQRRRQDDADLLAEIRERAQAIALFQADLEVETDGEERLRLRNGITYEATQLGDRQAELARRQRAVKYGYAPSRGPHPDLSARFARQREQGLAHYAEIAASLTGCEPAWSGSRLILSCPWHSDADPSLSVYPDGWGHCFSCGFHADVTGFVSQWIGCGMTEALRLLEEGAVGHG